MLLICRNADSICASKLRKSLSLAVRWKLWPTSPWKVSCYRYCNVNSAKCSTKYFFLSYMSLFKQCQVSKLLLSKQMYVCVYSMTGRRKRDFKYDYRFFENQSSYFPSPWRRLSPAKHLEQEEVVYTPNLYSLQWNVPLLPPITLMKG